MRRASIKAAVLALGVLTASVVLAACSGGVEETIDQHFASLETDTNPGATVGSAELIRRDDGLEATAEVSGMKEDGVYTFWWLVIPEGKSFPEDIGEVWVASGGAKVVGSDGKATAQMSADFGQSGIEGFHDVVPATTAPFRPALDMVLETAEVHVEIAYHGQATDADYSDAWLEDFWSGTACPEGDPVYNPIGTGAPDNVFNHIGAPQAHCPVSYAAIFPGE